MPMPNPLFRPSEIALRVECGVANKNSKSEYEYAHGERRPPSLTPTLNKSRCHKRTDQPCNAEQHGV